MAAQPWDIKLWVISILVGLALSVGTYNLKTMAMELNGVKERAQALIIRQAVDDERFVQIRADILHVAKSIDNLENLIERTHPRGK